MRRDRVGLIPDSMQMHLEYIDCSCLEKDRGSCAFEIVSKGTSPR